MAARQFGAKPEARRAVRRVVDLECEIHCELWGVPILHRVTDVSEDGLWIQTELLLEIGTEVTLTFFPPDWEEPLCVAGRVQRVGLRPRSEGGGAVGMGVGFESLRVDERRRLIQSMRCLRAQESFILDQRTLTGVPVSIAEDAEWCSPGEAAGTVSGWSAPRASGAGRPSRITTTPRARAADAQPNETGFAGGLDLLASVFASED